jgi:hypothetical protein
MGYAYDLLSVGVKGLNVNAAWAVADAASAFQVYFQCSKWGGVTMPGFGNIFASVDAGFGDFGRV